jgi:ABC-type branched-subunit amino acid transport system permease subunit
MLNKSLFLGIVSGVLAGVAGVLYAHIYYKINEADFSMVVSPMKIVAASLVAGILAAVGYTILDRLLKRNGEIVFNFVFTIISLASLLVPIAYKLPLNLGTPDLFPGMVIPMHFFPALSWYTLKPLFIRK